MKIPALPASMLMFVLTAGAWAQVSLPTVNVPQLPIDLPVDINRTASGVTTRLEPRELRNLRLLRIRNLIREQRDVIEADPQGAPILRSEVLAFSPSDAVIERARAAGFAELRRRTLEGLDATIVVLRAPMGMSTRRALKQLQALDPDGTYDFNHVYTESGVVAAHQLVDASVSSSAATAATELPSPLDENQRHIRIGLIDGGIDIAHPVFHQAVIHSSGCSGRTIPSVHGTAVASLLIGNAPLFHGAAPGAELYAADVYCGAPTGGAVDAVASAFAWFVRERVPTINVSLVGPPNALLQNIIRMMVARGFIVVAAVGNDGPAAAALYPASYPGVIGVTGVDARRRVLLEAGRGAQVDFAAPGADMLAAGSTQSYAAVRGTSFAAPLVAGLIAARLLVPDEAASAGAVAVLVQQAVDLGSRGPDRTYGNGLVGEGLRIDLAAVKNNK